MSKVSFRARAIDANRPLHIHYDHEILDLADYSSISRQVPLLPTGMEKEEETEEHLQEALFAQQQFRSTDLHAIPIPEIDENANRFKSLYQSLPPVKLPKNYIRIQSFYCDTLENETAEYDMDSEDENWLAQSRLDITEALFENMLAQLERSSDHKVISLKDAKLMLKQDDGVTTAVYDYWLTKRLKQRSSLIPQLKVDRRDGTSNSDPYVAFRRRTEKMQTRKHRKIDETCYEKMLILKKDMERATALFELLLRREELKRDLIRAESQVFSQRVDEKDYDGSKIKAVLASRHLQLKSRESNSRKRAGLDIRWPSPKKAAHLKEAAKAKQSAGKLNQSVIKPDVIQRPSDGIITNKTAESNHFSFSQRRLGAVYLPPTSSLWPAEESQSYQLTCLPQVCHSRRKQFTGYVRLRRGRGGRVWIDRHTSHSDSYLAARDVHYSVPPSPPPLQDAFTEEVIEEDTLWGLKVEPYALDSRPLSSSDSGASSPSAGTAACFSQQQLVYGGNGLRHCYRQISDELL